MYVYIYVFLEYLKLISIIKLTYFAKQVVLILALGFFAYSVRVSVQFMFI